MSYNDYENDNKRRFISPAVGRGKKQKVSRNVGEENYIEVESPGTPRPYTVSMAVPGSILDETCLLDELRTYVVGQIARAANIYSVDEIIVYDDGSSQNNYSYDDNKKHESIDMMSSLLKYQECPQYLRKHLFGYNPHLRKVGVLNALNSPHHLTTNQWCKYREGVVLERGNKESSFVDVGLDAEISVDKKLTPGDRVTVEIPPECQEMKKPYGIVVTKDTPREKDGFYWGFDVKIANSLGEIIKDSTPKYDLIIGTSDKGENSKKVKFPKFNKALIVFGGVNGLEEIIQNDEKFKKKDPTDVFHHYLNTCPLQQTKTIRTEEAILITLCNLSPKLAKNMKLFD